MLAPFAHGTVAEEVAMAMITAKQALTAAGRTPADHPDQLDMTATSSLDKTNLLRPLFGAVAIGAVILGLWLIQHYVHDSSYSRAPASPTPAAGLTVFAVFFVAAAAIERLLEPIAALMPNTTEQKTIAKTAVVAAGNKTASVAASTTPAALTAAQTALNDAANEVDGANWSTYWKTVSLWAIATVIAMLGSAFLKLYFLHAVGIAAGPRPVEILSTGLIIGAGTKPLHDLVDMLQASSAAKTAA
jgi:hypothetical protein